MMNDSKHEVNGVFLSRPARHERGESRREGFSSNNASSPPTLSSLGGKRGSVVARPECRYDGDFLTTDGHGQTLIHSSQSAFIGARLWSKTQPQRIRRRRRLGPIQRARQPGQAAAGAPHTAALLSAIQSLLCCPEGTVEVPVVTTFCHSSPSTVPSGLVGFGPCPGVETPGYSHDVPSGQSRKINFPKASRPGLRHGFHEFSRMVLAENQSVLIRAIRVFPAIRVHSCSFVVFTSIPIA